MPFKWTLSIDMGEGWTGVTCKNNKRPTLVSNQDFLHFGLGDMNSYRATLDDIYVHL